jgi:hypothetical protein
VSHWGYLLLIAFVAIGLRRGTEHRATLWVVGLSLVSIAYALHTYGGLR